ESTGFVRASLLLTIQFSSAFVRGASCRHSLCYSLLGRNNNFRDRLPAHKIVLRFRDLKVLRPQCITSRTKASAECARLKRAVLVGGHSARLTVQKIVSRGGNGVRT